GLLPLLVPAVREAALVAVDPLLRDVVRCVRRAGREVDEERPVGRERLLRSYPRDRVIGEVLGEVIALLWGPVDFHGCGAVGERRAPLVVLAADETVEVLESRAGRPHVEGADRAVLENRHLVALAELRRRVAVQSQRLRERRLGVRPQRGV